MKRQCIRLLLAALLALAACSGDKPPASAFKAQTDAVHKAEDVNKMVEDQAAAQSHAIDEQSQ